jgi:hypothetical protein
VVQEPPFVSNSIYKRFGNAVEQSIIPCTFQNVFSVRASDEIRLDEKLIQDKLETAS